MAEALIAVKANAQTILPKLTQIVLNTEPKVKCDSRTRGSALRVIAQYGLEAPALLTC